MKRTFGITTWALNNQKTVVLFTWLALIGGIVLYLALPRENFPDVSFPEVFVRTSYPGYEPQEIERLIVKPIENELKRLEGVVEVRSVIKTGAAITIAKFEHDYDMDEAHDEVKIKVDELYSRGDLPADLPQKPTVTKLDIAELRPALNVNISGNYDEAQLRKWAEDLKDLLEGLEHVSTIDIVGVQEREVAVLVDLPSLIARNLTIMEVVNAVREANFTISAGELKTDGLVRPLRVSGDIKSPSQLENIVIRSIDGQTILLKDIATIRFQLEEPESFSRLYGKKVVSLVIKKRKEANLIELSEKTREIVSNFKTTHLPQDVEIHITGDLSEHTKEQVSNLENSIISGLILVLLIMTLFMGFREAIFVALAIPFSMLIAFIILYLSDITLNTPVLFALVLALGMLVDNGIVIVENILKFRERGYDLFYAVKYGVGEVAVPIITSTATTVAAFLPLGLWPGIIGEFMSYLPITLISVLSGSLLVALVINPVFIARYTEKPAQFIKGKTQWIKNGKRALIYTLIIIAILSLASLVATKLISLPDQVRKTITAISLFIFIASVSTLAYRLFLYKTVLWFQNTFLTQLESMYAKHLTWFLTGFRPYIVLFVSVALFIGGIFAIKFRNPHIHFFPNVQPDQGYVYIEFPEGVDITVTDSFTRNIAQKIYNYIYSRGYDTSGITAIIEQVGEGAYDIHRGIEPGKTRNKGKITIDFSLDRYKKGINSDVIMDTIRSMLGNRAGISLYTGKLENKPPMGYPVSLELYGEDYITLYKFANYVKRYFDSLNIPGLQGLQMNINRTYPQTVAHVDRDMVNHLGLSMREIALTLRTALNGTEASTLNYMQEDHPINVRLHPNYRYNTELLKLLKVPNLSRTALLPLANVVSFENISDFNAIYRKNTKRYIMLYSNVEKGYGAPEVIAQMQKHLKQMSIPPGVSYKFTGEQEEMRKNVDYLTKAFAIALFLILIILVTEFNSYSQPLIILISVVFSITGVLWGIALTGMDIVVIMTMIGAIALAGIVVNNAIVLVDYTNLTLNRMKEENDSCEMSKEDLIKAIVHAGTMRLRPVLLTAITTVLGMLPLAIGFNIDFIGLFTDLKPDIYFGGRNFAYWGPLALTVIFGLTFSTLLTLVVVPIMYLIVTSSKNILLANSVN
ncbi:MAG: efflux RND transporter permease subunit [Chlorobi bacterium]|nr:efflux RND transporter permease subunit [Chlorobiota bacterium]